MREDGVTAASGVCSLFGSCEQTWNILFSTFLAPSYLKSKTVSHIFNQQWCIISVV
jgi:hypothetical protein